MAGRQAIRQPFMGASNAVIAETPASIMTSKSEFTLGIILGLSAIGIGLVAMIALWPCEYARMVSPDGTHVAIIKYRGYQNFISVFPGSSGDKSGWMVIQDMHGHELGHANLPMIQMGAEIMWSSDSVEVPLINSWKF